MEPGGKELPGTDECSPCNGDAGPAESDENVHETGEENWSCKDVIEPLEQPYGSDPPSSPNPPIRRSPPSQETAIPSPARPSCDSAEEVKVQGEPPASRENMNEPDYGVYFVDNHMKQPPFIEASTATGCKPSRLAHPPGKALFTRNPAELQGTMITTAVQKSARGFGFTIIGGDEPEEFLQVKSLVPDGPAASLGTVQTGDVIVAVNGTCVLGHTHAEVVRVFQAVPIGQAVRLQMCRGYPLPCEVEEMSISVGMHDVALLGEGLEHKDGGNHTSQASTSGVSSQESPRDSLGLTPPEGGIPDVFSIRIVKGTLGFGFTITDTPSGQRVKQILDGPRCRSLCQADLLLEVNGIPVRARSHSHVVELLKECSPGLEVSILIQRDGGNSSPRTATQIFIGAVVPMGAAAREGRLRPGDELRAVDGTAVAGASHRHVVALMQQAARNGHVHLALRRPAPESQQASPLVEQAAACLRHAQLVADSTVPPPPPCRTFELQRGPPEPVLTNWQHFDLHRGTTTISPNPWATFDPSRPLLQEHGSKTDIGELHRAWSSLEGSRALEQPEMGLPPTSWHWFDTHQGMETVWPTFDVSQSISEAGLLSGVALEPQPCIGPAYEVVPCNTPAPPPPLSPWVGFDSPQGQSPSEARRPDGESIAWQESEAQKSLTYEVTLERKENEGFGFVIVSSLSRPEAGTVVGRIIAGSPAERCGQLHVSDRILGVNGTSLDGLSHAAVIQLIRDSGTMVTLRVGPPTEPVRTAAPASKEQPVDLTQCGQDNRSEVKARQDIVPEPTQNLVAKQNEQAIQEGELYGVELEQGPRGYGFSLRGGREYGLHLFILRLAEDGPASRTGKLRIGDQIVEINGESAEAMTHARAIELIRNSCGRARLILRRGSGLVPDYGVLPFTPTLCANNNKLNPAYFYMMGRGKEQVCMQNGGHSVDCLQNLISPVVLH
uniref:membrane-associated guanylate kinase, WW and PDZ domain-containing protein 1-like n=1 Tax=Myxine glutinosa TaxID=7769 RepID=UPI00358E25E6